MLTLMKLKVLAVAVLAIAAMIGLWYGAYASQQVDADGQDRPIEKVPADAVHPAANQPEPKQKAADDRIKPGDRLRIVIQNGIPDAQNDGVFLVEPSGKLALDPTYGRVAIGGLSPEDAETFIRKHLVDKVTLKGPLVQVTRYDPVNDDKRVTALEARVKVLEAALSKLSNEVAELRKK